MKQSSKRSGGGNTSAPRGTRVVHRRRMKSAEVTGAQLFREIDAGYHRFWSKRGGAPVVGSGWQKY